MPCNIAQSIELFADHEIAIANAQPNPTPADAVPSFIITSYQAFLLRFI